MTYIVSSGALNSTHSLFTAILVPKKEKKTKMQMSFSAEK